MQKDLERVSGNHHALLNAMTQIVLLVNSDGTIEYMNPSAQRFLGLSNPGHSDENILDAHTCEALLGIITSFPETGHVGSFRAHTLNNTQIEYSVAPFSGYNGEHLNWLIIRDLTEQKMQQDELSQYRENLETILTIKISELKESEGIRRSLSKHLTVLENHIRHYPPFGEMVGSSKELHKIRDLVFQIDKSTSTVLITGESGTGKELVANLIYETSDRKDKPFVKINCLAINDSLLESELFGHERGAFTGADTRRKGKFEMADGGTVFLDEIGDISPRMQAALLRVLQDGEFMRVGGTSQIKVDVRVIAATNADLNAAVNNGLFRLDLFYRLNIIHVHVPPLRERKEDITDLIEHFIQYYSTGYNKNIEAIPENVIKSLTEYEWPGNVRELENVIQRALLVSHSNMISLQDLSFDLSQLREPPAHLSSFFERKNGSTLKETLSEIEKEILVVKLKQLRGNVQLAANELKISKTALYDKLKRYNINPKDVHWA
jgi:transcriptional regulator with PAS, ATPase and Fis domain